MYLVGLTGGIGSGKTTVARRLAQLGCEVIDADEVARAVVEPGEPAFDDLVERFGDRILAGDGRLDRRALASLAFSDPDARSDLERITHPRIAAVIERRLTELADTWGQRSGHIVVVDHPLLVETGQHERFDAVVVVHAPEEMRVRRMLERGLEESDVRARMAAQVGDAERRQAATHLVANDGGHDALVVQVDALHERLRAAAEG